MKSREIFWENVSRRPFLLQMEAHPAILVLWTLLKLVSLSGKQGLGHGWENLDESPATCYESLGKTALYITDCKTIVYLPLRPLSSQINTVEFYVVYTEVPCSRADIRKSTACRHLNDLNTHQVEAGKRYRGAGSKHYRAEK